MVNKSHSINIELLLTSIFSNARHFILLFFIKGRCRRPKVHILDDPFGNPNVGLKSTFGHPMGPKRTSFKPL